MQQRALVMHVAGAQQRGRVLSARTLPARRKMDDWRRENRARTHRLQERLCGRFGKAGRVPLAARHRLSALARSAPRRAGAQQQSARARATRRGRPDLVLDVVCFVDVLHRAQAWRAHRSRVSSLRRAPLRSARGSGTGGRAGRGGDAAAGTQAWRCAAGSCRAPSHSAPSAGFPCAAIPALLWPRTEFVGVSNFSLPSNVLVLLPRNRLPCSPCPAGHGERGTTCRKERDAHAAGPPRAR